MSQISPVIVVIEDDPAIRLFLRTGLSSYDFKVFEAERGQQGIVEAGVRKPDLIILDLGLPDMDGVDVINAIRAWSAMPIIILSARSGEQQKIDALDAGADDYLTKPFGLGELLARIRVALRHSLQGTQDPHGIFSMGELSVDLAKRQVFVGDQEIHLTPIQYRLLSVLVKNAGKVLTQQYLLNEVWGSSYRENSHYLRIYMSPTPPKTGSRTYAAAVFIDRIWDWLSAERLVPGGKTCCHAFLIWPPGQRILYIVT